MKCCNVMQCLVISFGISCVTDVVSQQKKFLVINATVRYNYSCPHNPTSSNSSGQYVVVKTDGNNKFSNYTRLTDDLERVESSKSMKEFLKKHIYWHVRIYEANNNGISSNNNTTHFSNLFWSSLCDACNNSENRYNNNNNNVDVFLFHLEKYYILVVILGLLSLFGNVIVMTQEIHTIIKQRVTDAKEKKVYNILVFNLCLANLLMAIYLIVGPIAYKLQRVSVGLCNGLGVASVLSMQVSASTLVIITTYRLFSVLFPFKSVHIKLTAALLLCVWSVWFIVVLLPLFSETLFAHEFTREIAVNDKDGSMVKIKLYVFLKTIQNLAHNINSTDKPFGQILNALSKYASNEVAVQLLKSFNLVNFKRVEINYVNYYYPSSGCTVSTFVKARNTTITYFSLIFLIVSLAEYLFILIAYLIIFKNISTLRFKNLFPCVSQTKSNLQGQTINTENRQVYIRIFGVVVTDLICGIPFCLIGLAYYFEGLAVTECFQSSSFKSWATPVVLILFPLNSIINPYIYSFHLRKGLLKRFKQSLLQRNSS